MAVAENAIEDTRNTRDKRLPPTTAHTLPVEQAHLSTFLCLPEAIFRLLKFTKGLRERPRQIHHRIVMPFHQRHDILPE